MSAETRVKAQLMSASEMDRTMVRLAHEILEKSKDLDLPAAGAARLQNASFSAN
jgi:pyrimidine operon attenuation protein/uracil phosphoribosyltransferase